MRLTRGAGHEGQRSLLSYLALPRPGDLVKAWIFPAAFALGVWGTGELSGELLLRAALVWVALELLLYQARYQCNDIRGFEADQRHPSCSSRGRLPGPLERGPAHKRASAAVVALRVLLVALLAAALPRLDLWLPLALLAAGVLLATLAYEVLRARATGSGEGVPPRLRPAIVGLWIAVGSGYAVRGIGGLGLAVSLAERPALLVSALVAMWGFGCAFAASRWAVEALDFARLEAGGLEWDAEPRQQREHLLALARWLPHRLPRGVPSPAEWRPLAGPTSPWAPWNLAAAVSATAGASTGLLLAGERGASVVVLSLGAATLTVCVLASPRREPALLVAAGLLIAGVTVAGVADPLLAVAPWLAIVAAHLWFSSRSPRDLARPLGAALRDALPHRGAGGGSSTPGAAAARHP